MLLLFELTFLGRSVAFPSAEPNNVALSLVSTFLDRTSETRNVVIPFDSTFQDEAVTFPATNCLVGLVVKASFSGAENLWFESRSRRGFSRSSHTSDLKIGTPVATLPGAWHYRLSAGTGRPGVSGL